MKFYNYSSIVAKVRNSIRHSKSKVLTEAFNFCSVVRFFSSRCVHLICRSFRKTIHGCVPLFQNNVEMNYLLLCFLKRYFYSGKFPFILFNLTVRYFCLYLVQNKISLDQRLVYENIRMLGNSYLIHFHFNM